MAYISALLSTDVSPMAFYLMLASCFLLLVAVLELWNPSPVKAFWQMRSTAYVMCAWISTFPLWSDLLVLPWVPLTFIFMGLGGIAFLAWTRIIVIPRAKAAAERITRGHLAGKVAVENDNDSDSD